VIKVSTLKKNPNNPRQIRGEKLALLKKSVTEFDKMMSLRPIIVDENNVVLGGNMRLAAIKALGHKEIPDEWVKRVDDLTEDEKREFIIKDNAGFGEWDWDVIANEWSDLPLADWGLDVPGFEAVEAVGEADAEPQTDKAAELNKKWGVASGDLWQIGEHRLVCGDSTKRDDVERLMGGDSFDLCFTSPPYNAGKGKGYKSDYNGKVASFYQDDSDDRTEEEWIEFCEEILFRCGEYVRDDASVIAWNVMYNANCRSGYGQVMFRGVHPFTVKETICWDKGNGFPSASKGILSRNWELVFILSKGEKYNTTQGDNEVRWGKWNIPRPEQGENHKATFPTELAAQAIEDFSFKGATVYEPFAGSGTTLVACQNLNRKCYAIEISENYCAVILERMATAFPDIEIKKLNGV